MVHFLKTMDPICELPKHIIYHIFNNDLYKTSVMQQNCNKYSRCLLGVDAYSFKHGLKHGSRIIFYLQ